MSFNQIDMVSPTIWGRFKGERWHIHKDGPTLYVDGISDKPIPLPLTAESTRIIPTIFGYKVTFEYGNKYVLDGLDKQNAKAIQNLMTEARHEHNRDLVHRAGKQLESAWECAAEQLPRAGYIQKHKFMLAHRAFREKASRIFEIILNHTEPSAALLSNKRVTRARNILENSESWLRETNNKRLAQEYKRFQSLFIKAGLRLTPEQAFAALSMERGNVLEAGAGSGKTVVIIARALYAVASGKFAASEVMCVAYNKKATIEIKDRLAKAFLLADVPGAEDIMVTTFHALGLKIVNAVLSDRVEVVDEKNTVFRALFKHALAAVTDQPENASVLKVFAKDLFEQSVINADEVEESVDALIAAERAFITSRYNFEGQIPTLAFNAAENPWGLSETRIQKIKDFARIVPLISKHFRTLLREAGKLDFPGMTVEGVRALEMLGKQHQCSGKVRNVTKRKCLLVDEFQDISFDRAMLVKRLADLNDDSVVFGVGDDWQAINRFSGADFTLFTKFDDFFGVTDRRQLTATFRSCRGIADSAREFIIRNALQSDKPINRVAQENIEDTILFLCYQQSDNILTVMERQIKAWCHESNGRPHVMVLDRNSLAKSRVLNSRLLRQLQKKFAEKVTISFETVHGSKGLEADYVIISGLIEGVFPSHRPPEYWVDMFLPREERNIPYADERRLFYVALTRAKHAVALLTPRRRASRFASELKGILNT